MMTTSSEIPICPNCGSIDYLPDYPTAGQKTCTKCGREIINAKLRTVKNAGEIQDNCPFCGSAETDIIRDEEEEDIVVYKCIKCGKLDGYRTYDDNQEVYDSYERSEVEYSPFRAKIAQDEGREVLSASQNKEMAKALKEKENSPKEKCKKQVFLLIRHKTEPLKATGISKEIITNAFYEAQAYIEDNGALTENQVLSLVAASISFAEDAQMRRREINKRCATERNIAKLFNVDRKTIRKWKRLLKEKRKPSKWGVYIYQKNGSLESGSIEIPKDLLAVIKLERPYKGKCCFLGGDYDLIWRIKYTNGCWSDICQSVYETFKKSYWEYEGSLELP